MKENRVKPNAFGCNIITNYVRFFKFSPSGIQKIAYNERLMKSAILRNDNSIEIWDCKDTPFYLKTIQKAEEGSRECLIWCNNRLFSGSLDGSVKEHALKIADRDAISLHSTVTVTGGACWSLAANSEGTLMAAGTESGYICLYAVRDDGIHFEKLLEKFPDRIFSLSWNMSGTHIAAASTNIIYICSLTPATPINIKVCEDRVKNNPAVIWCIKYLPNDVIVTGDSRGFVTFWCGETYTRINEFRSHKAPVLALANCKSTGHVFASGVDPKIRKFIRQDSGTWVPFGLVTDIHTHDVRSMVVDHRERLLSGGADTSLGVYFYPPKTTYLLPSLPRDSRVSLANGDAAFCYNDKVEWWRLGKVDTGAKMPAKRCLLPMAQDRVLISSIESAGLLCCSLNRSANTLAYSSEKRTLRLLKLLKPQGSDSMSLSKLEVPESPQNSKRLLQWLTDSLLLTVDTNNQLMLYEVTSSTVSLKETFAPNSNEGSDCDIVSLTTSLCGNYFATVTAGGVATVHHLNKRSELVLPSQKANITALHIDSCNNTVLVAYADHMLLEFDINSGIITPFGATLGSISRRVGRTHVTSGISMLDVGKVLCLHDDVSITYVGKKAIENFNWMSLPQKKVRLEETNGYGTIENGHSEIPEASEFVSKRKRAHRDYSKKKDPYELEWAKLVDVTSRNDSYVMQVTETSDKNCVSVELTKDTITYSLPMPFVMNKMSER